MSAKKKFTWLISPKSFIQLIGAEYDILKNSGSAALVKFYIAAVAILLILIISACSIFYAMELLFHMVHVEIVLSIFVSFLFVFIYVFLLNTFSKNIFKPDKEENQSKWFSRIKLSDIIRTGFVVFMAFLISKPVEVFVFKNELIDKVKIHREEVLREYEQKVSKLNDKDLRKLKNSIDFYEIQLEKYQSPALQHQIAQLYAKITEINNKQAGEISLATLRVERSDFLLFRIKKVSKKTIAWVICLGITALFLLPGFLIYSISATDAYYKLKQEYEINMVLEEYKAFQGLYTDIFKQRYQLDRSYYSKFLDPPFNNKVKPGPAFQSQKEFFNKYSSQ